MRLDSIGRRLVGTYFKWFLVFWQGWDSCWGEEAFFIWIYKNSFLILYLPQECFSSLPQWLFQEIRALTIFVAAILIVTFRVPWDSILSRCHRISRIIFVSQIIYLDVWFGFGRAGGRRSRPGQHRQRMEIFGWLYCWFLFYIESYGLW